MGLVDAVAAIRSGAARPTELVERALEIADERAELNAMAHVASEQALREAGMLDREARAGAFRGPLHGVPLTVKDLFVVDGMPTRCGARAPMPDLGAQGRAVARLRAAGAVIVGKTNMVEIALGTTGENPFTGDVRNPRDPARMSGGSSSGSAVAVRAGIGFGSLGTDTAGSIRIPSAWCGVTGFKPTHGAVPLDGALPLCPTCDHAGPIARDVADCALLFGVLADDGRRPPAIAAPRLGVPRRHLDGALGAPMRRAFEALLDRLRREGASIVDVDPEGLGLVPEAFAPLRAESAHVHRAALESCPEGFSPFVRSELERGARVTPDEHAAALRAREIVRAGLDASLRGVDAIVMPSVPVTAPPRGTTEVELESGRVPLRQAVLHLSRPFALAGLPTVSLPFGSIDGLPAGVDVACAEGADPVALCVSAWIEARI